MNNLLKISILFLFTFNLYSNDKVSITNGEWPPYFSQTLPNYGITSELVTKAFESQDIAVQYHWYPWKRAYHLAKEAKFNATIGWAKTNEREKDFLFSDPILEGKVVFFYLKSTNFNWKNLENLRNIKIGSVTGYKYANKLEFLKEKNSVKIFSVIDEKKLFELLINKRYDVAVINLDAGKAILKQYFKKEPLDKITYHKIPFHTEYLRVLFNKKDKENEAYLNALNKGLKNMREKSSK